jgi:hypothetical protein
MDVLKTHSHKNGLERLLTHMPDLHHELTKAIQSLDPTQTLTKISAEPSRVRRWGGLIFSPRAINTALKKVLYPQGWAEYNSRTGKYLEPTIYFPGENAVPRSDRYRKMDGLKQRVGLEIQLGKYAFMGYDVFSKFIIFSRKGLIDIGVEIVLVQEMVNRMSTGVSAFEHLMIDFQHRGEADIDIPVVVLGIGLTPEEWLKVNAIQQLYRDDPQRAVEMYPNIGLHDLKGTKPGPK